MGILLKSDDNGSAWTDEKIAQAYDGHPQGVVGVQGRFVENGFRRTLDGTAKQSWRKVSGGEQETKIITLYLGDPPSGCAV